MISIIAAIGENRELGKEGKIPWRIPADLQRFKTLTTDRTIIIGRKTFESLIAYYQGSGRPMPKRNTIIVTRDRYYSLNEDNCYVVPSIEEALKLARKIEPIEVFFVGGAQIYKQALPYADKLYLTFVKGTFDADAFFPDYSEFKKVIKEDKRESVGYKYAFIELEK